MFKKVFLLVVFIILLQSCKNDESAQVFSDVPSVRLQKEIQKVQNLLTSSTNGWKQDFQAATNKKISSINIYFKDDYSSPPYLRIMIKDDSAGTDLFAWFDIQYTITEDPVTGTDIIKFTPTGNSNPNGMEAPLKPITDFFFRNKGFYMYQTGKLQRWSNKKIGLIPVGRWRGSTYGLLCGKLTDKLV